MARVMPLHASFHLHCILEGRRHGVQPTKAHLVSRWESAFALTELSEASHRCRNELGWEKFLSGWIGLNLAELKMMQERYHAEALFHRLMMD